MNICVITPLYPVIGRNDIKTDTQAIHLLLKYLSKDNNIHVFNISRVSPRQFIRSILLKADNLRSQYDYKIDGIDASLLRYRAYPKQRVLTKKQISIVRQRIKCTLDNKGFTPDAIVVHNPSSFPDIIDGLFDCAKRVAVLHRTDVNNITAIPELVNGINQQYSVISCRSHSVKRKAQEIGIRVDERIVFSGIPKTYMSANYIHHFNNLKNQVKLLYVGKLIKRKHPEYLISLCCDLNEKGIDAYALIIGDGPLKGKIKAAVENTKYKEKIELIESVAREQVQEYMRKVDIFILPSVNETLGLVYLEAMAAGCITIGVLDEGIDGVIRNKINGYLIKPENYNDLVDCLDSIIEKDKIVIQKISQNAIKTANSIPEEVAAENYFMLMK